MGRRSEQTFSCRGHSGGQQAHKKMFNIANHQGNTNQNHSRSTSHLSEWLLSKRTQTTNVSKDVDKREPCTLLVDMQIGAVTMENSMEDFQKTKNTTTI